MLWVVILHALSPPPKSFFSKASSCLLLTNKVTMSNHENKLINSTRPSFCTACRYFLLLDCSHSLRLEHSPEMHVVTDISYKILTLLRCCSNQYQLLQSKKETNSSLKNRCHQIILFTQLILKIYSRVCCSGYIVKNPSTHTFYGFEQESKLNREDCFLSGFVHLHTNVCLHSSGTFTEEEAMSK